MSNLQNYNHYVSEFQSFEQNGASQAPPWIHDIRKSAMNVFTEKGFPTTKQEDWKYTNVAPISKIPFRYASNKLLSKVSSKVVDLFRIDSKEQHELVFIDGHLSLDHSNIGNLPKSVVLASLIDAYKSHGAVIQKHLSKYIDHTKNTFAAMNTAFLNDGVFIHIPSTVEVKGLIHCIFISTATNGQQFASFLRNLVVVEEGARVQIAFSYRSSDLNSNLTNVVTEIVAAKNSNVEIAKIQSESDSTYHVENFRVHQFEKSIANVFSLALGSAIARNDMSVILDGEEADCNLNGLYFTTGEQLIDHHTFMHHIHPHCPSHELFKGILDGNSRAVFNGKVYVEPEAQKTDSKQTNRNLLLSDTAVVDTKPELEIFADDVKCTHGAAVGGMNPVHTFYLKSRGIGEESARRILTVGFAAEVTGKIINPEVRRHIDTLVVNRLREKLGSMSLPDIVHS